MLPFALFMGCRAGRHKRHTAGSRPGSLGSPISTGHGMGLEALQVTVRIKLPQERAYPARIVIEKIIDGTVFRRVLRLA